MKSITAILFGCALLSMACESSTSPGRGFLYEVISFSDLPTQAMADSTFYSFSGNSSLLWSSDSAVVEKRIDSILTAVRSKGIVLKQAWYQPASSSCGMLTYAPPAILVVKLISYDSRIRNLSFSDGLTNFHDCPGMRYRRYIF
jgi:hypothetical protein